MKTNILITIILLLPSIANAQWVNSYNKNFGLENDLLPANLILSYRVRAHDTLFLDKFPSEFNPKSNNIISYTKRVDQPGKSLDAIIFESIFSEKTKIYSLHQTGLYPYEIKESRPINYSMLLTSIAMYDMSLKNINRNFDRETFESYIFCEEWLYNENNFVFKKKIISYIPVLKYFIRYGKQSDRPAYLEFSTIYTDSLPKTKEADFKFISHIEHDHFISTEGDIEDPWRTRFYEGYYESPYWNGIAKTRFIRNLVKNILDGKRLAYDYKTKEVLNKDEVIKRLGEREKIVNIEDVNTGKITQKIEHIGPKLHEIAALMFIEDWYINPNTLELRKDVIGVAPVVYKYKEDDKDHQDPERNVLFVVYFNKDK